MQPQTGLLWIFILFAMPLKPTQGCSLNRMNFTEGIIEKLLHLFVEANGDVSCKPTKIPELHFDPSVLIKDQKQRVHCIFSYAHEALQLIKEHQSDLHGETANIIKNITETQQQLTVTMGCVKKDWGECKNKTTPVFSDKNTYHRKQWGRSVLENFLTFLKELLTEHKRLFEVHKSNHTRQQYVKQRW
nr:uncharacterized protein osm [Misgurnus anguillicaudatus]